MEANNKSNLTELVKQITEVSMQVEEGIVKSVTIKNIVPYTPMIETGTGYTNQAYQFLGHNEDGEPVYEIS